MIFLVAQPTSIELIDTSCWLISVAGCSCPCGSFDQVDLNFNVAPKKYMVGRLFYLREGNFSWAISFRGVFWERKTYQLLDLPSKSGKQGFIGIPYKNCNNPNGDC